MGTLYLQPMGQKWLGILSASEGSPMEPPHLWSLSLTLTPHKQCQNGIKLLDTQLVLDNYCWNDILALTGVLSLSLSPPAARQLAPLL